MDPTRILVIACAILGIGLAAPYVTSNEEEIYRLLAEQILEARLAEEAFVPQLRDDNPRLSDSEVEAALADSFEDDESISRRETFKCGFADKGTMSGSSQLININGSGANVCQLRCRRGSHAAGCKGMMFKDDKCYLFTEITDITPVETSEATIYKKC
ncbi:uncharacterized protein LOC141907659 [Tubulanus polymorphus]|uniref:uncharacterized protein LOC141907659 n=1 Tax=Tubulanus polymorphus TaxID=672921 RepID=UPI003DA62BE8